MEDCEECINSKRQIAAGFSACREVILALGNESRGRIVLALLEGPERGMRLCELVETTHMSRPSVLRHLAVLRRAAPVSSRKEHTSVYYFMDANVALWEELADFFSAVCDTVKLAAEQGYPAPTEEEEESV